MGLRQAALYIELLGISIVKLYYNLFMCCLPLTDFARAIEEQC